MAGDRVSAYFSHSYRVDDESLNLYFWNLFSEAGIWFSVDPKSDFLSVPYLEWMMHTSGCYVAVAPFRAEEDYTRCSPFIVFEYEMALRSNKPMLVLVEESVGEHVFGPESPQVCTFDRDALDADRDRFRSLIDLLARQARAAGLQRPRRRGKVGLLLGQGTSSTGPYPPELVEEVMEMLQRSAFRPEIVPFRFKTPAEAILALRGYDFLIVEVNPELQPEWITSFLLGRYVPCLKLFAIPPGADRATANLPPLFPRYAVKRFRDPVDSVIYWSSSEELLQLLGAHVKKFDYGTLTFRSGQDGDRYFKSIGREPAKVFISNAGEANETAVKLANEFKLSNIAFFHYKEKRAIPSGADWKEVIRRNVSSSHVFVPLFTKGYLESEWCQRELDIAKNLYAQGKMVILPYLLEPCSMAVLPDMQAPDLQKDPIEERVRRIVEDVDQALKPQAASISV